MTASDAPACHRCGAPPAFQWTRLAGDDERAARRRDVFALQGRELSDEEIDARYGPALIAVTGCAEHAFGTDPDDEHSGAGRRALLHGVDCAGHGSCACSGLTGSLETP